MNAEPFVNNLGCTGGEDTARAVQVFIAYDDLAAGVRAMHVLADLGKGLGDAIEFRPTPWSFELLINSHWRESAAGAALQADILMIATSCTRLSSAAVHQWIETILHRKRGMDSAIVALFGSDKGPDVSGSSCLSAIRTAAQTAGLAFFAPCAESAPGTAALRIHHHTESIHSSPNTIHPHHRPPHWGINE
jgi:hypothetical protein